MRTGKALLAVLALLSLSAAVQAAGRLDRGRAQPWRQTWGSRSYRYRLSPFDLARRLTNLTEEQQATVSKLQRERYDEYRKKLTEVGRELDQKFAALVVEVLGQEHKDAFEKVLAAIAERDAAIEAAREEALTVLRKLREEQGFEPRTRGYYYASYIRRTKPDIVRYYVKLTDDQRTQFDQIRRDGWAALRDIPRPDNWRDADARRQYGEAVRKAREGIDEKHIEAMIPLLTDEQKKTYETAQGAAGAYQKKTKDAEEACDKKLIALLGEEKFKALTRLQRTTRVQAPAKAEKKAEGKTADF